MDKYVRYNLEKRDAKANKELMGSCITKYRKSSYEIDTTAVILKELWKRLKDTHDLRVVK